MRLPEIEAAGGDVPLSVTSESLWGSAEECFMVNNTTETCNRSYAAGLVAFRPSFVEYFTGGRLAFSEV